MTLRLVSNAWPSRRLAGGPPPLPGAVACPCTQVAQKEEAEAEAKAAEAAALAKAAKIKAMVEGKGSAAAEAAAAAAAASVTSADEEDHSRAPWHFPPVYAALLRRQGPKRRGGGFATGGRASCGPPRLLLDAGRPSGLLGHMRMSFVFESSWAGTEGPGAGRAVAVGWGGGVHPARSFSKPHPTALRVWPALGRSSWRLRRRTTRPSKCIWTKNAGSSFAPWMALRRTFPHGNAPRHATALAFTTLPTTTTAGQAHLKHAQNSDLHRAAPSQKKGT